MAARAEALTPARSGHDGPSSSAAIEVPAPSAEPPGDGSWTFSPTGAGPSAAPLSSAALADAVRAGVRAIVAEDTKRLAEDKKRNDPLRLVLPRFGERDIALGLIPGGELVTATRDAVHDAPTMGHALLEFQIDGAGVVASVRVVDASSDRTDWEELAVRLAKATGARTIRVPSGAKGVALTLEVTSAMKNVSGSAPTDKAITKALRAINDPIDAVLDGTGAPQKVVAVRVVDVHTL